MKLLGSILRKILGVLLFIPGCLVAIAVIGTTIATITDPTTRNEIMSYILYAILGVIAFLLIYSGRRLMAHGRNVPQETDEDIQAKENELRELEHKLHLDALREEAQIRQQKYEAEQLELQNKIAEQKQLEAAAIEAEKQRVREAEIRNAEIRKASGIFLTGEQIERLEQKIELPNLDDCDLILQYGEIAVYGSRAVWHASKTEFAHQGHLHITNQRIGFVSEDKSFILFHDDIIAVIAKDEGLVLQAKQRAYNLELPRADLASIAIKGLRSGMPIANTSKNVVPHVRQETGITANVSMVDGMEGHEFEHFCAKLLEANGFSDVEVTRGSGDQGVDILASKGGIKYAIQCKNYASKLGNTPIQEVNAGKIFYNCHVGVVMTNSTFTPKAEELAASTNVILWDRPVLDRFIKNSRKAAI